MNEYRKHAADPCLCPSSPHVCQPPSDADGAGARAVNDLRLLGRVAAGLALLALLAAALALHALHALHAQRAAMQARLGATFAGAAGGAGGGRPIVTSLRRGGPAAAAGLAVGDVVEAVDSRPTGSLAELDRAVASGIPAAMHVRRGAQRIGVIVR